MYIFVKNFYIFNGEIKQKMFELVSLMILKWPLSLIDIFLTNLRFKILLKNREILIFDLFFAQKIEKKMKML